MILNQERILEIFSQTEAILKGHFLLSSGLHSDTYFQCAKITEHPIYAEELCEMLSQLWKQEKPQVVAGPAYGGIILSYIIARDLGARAVFAERVNGKFVLRRGFRLSENERVLVAEDVITTGGSAGEIIHLVREHKAVVIGVTCLVRRCAQNPFDVPLKGLIQIVPPIYKPQDCPLCHNGIPLEKPGSR